MPGTIQVSGSKALYLLHHNSKLAVILMLVLFQSSSGIHGFSIIILHLTNVLKEYAMNSNYLSCFWEFLLFFLEKRILLMFIFHNAVSMGKREYQTWDKGDFFFPLTTLRNNLIVTLQDAQGKEISHIVVETRLVIEKGVWDDIFPFEGGGHVHMKLQFVLNEEDRQRIRIMRESALRKKHDELLNSELRSPTHATTVGSNVAPSLMFNHDVSDSHRTLLQREVIEAGLSSIVCSILFNKGKSGRKDVEGTHFTNDPSRIIYSEEASFLGSSGSVVAAKNQAPAELKADEANDPEKRSPLEKTPGKIRNMISAFENSLNQDMRPTPIKSQSSKTTHRTGDVQQASTHIRKREEQIGFVRALAGSTSSHETGQLEELRAGRIQAKGKKKDLKDKVKVMHKVDIQEANTSSEKLARASTGERASVSGRMLIEKGIHLLSNLFARRRHSGGNPLKQKNGKGIQAEVLQDANIQGNSGGQPHSSECYGAWIFPDGGKGLCITAGGTQIMDLMRSGHAEEKGQLGQMSYPIAENGREICVPGGTDIQGKAGDETSPSQRHKESIIEGSTDAETSRGPIGQVMRAVIMVGFATLVFFTRQRKPDN
ncbi:uncharacterized protein LOC110647031 isoform X3 [Hevea brasiliensis]|uniref:uncharacterized protein LOC110647031 isoform X3 n=1 Tax=Hevea brasiliensis TaxID=3981 RepID=UPI0025E2DCFC|nr:uncharacterized protein LOC110647031 isoform X3 [Hevea brasiliensis]